MPQSKITLYTDLRSGFTYLTFHTLTHSPIFHNHHIQITYVPVDLRALWQTCNNHGAWPVTNKPAWIIKSSQIWARKFNIPFNGPPEGFLELSTTQVQRALCVLAREDQEGFVSVMGKLLEVFWVRSERADQREIFGRVFEAVLGVEGARRVLDRAETSEAEEMLKSNTNAAFKAGAFGLPYIHAVNAQGQEETFFGFDHLGLVVDFLGLARPASNIPGDAGWAALL